MKYFIVRKLIRINLGAALWLYAVLDKYFEDSNEISEHVIKIQKGLPE